MWPRTHPSEKKTRRQNEPEATTSILTKKQLERVALLQRPVYNKRLQRREEERIKYLNDPQNKVITESERVRRLKLGNPFPRRLGLQEYSWGIHANAGARLPGQSFPRRARAGFESVASGEQNGPDPPQQNG